MDDYFRRALGMLVVKPANAGDRVSWVERSGERGWQISRNILAIHGRGVWLATFHRVAGVNYDKAT